MKKEYTKIRDQYKWATRKRKLRAKKKNLDVPTSGTARAGEGADRATNVNTTSLEVSKDMYKSFFLTMFTRIAWVLPHVTFANNA